AGLLDDCSHGAAGSYHQGEAIGSLAAAADIVAGAVTQRRIPWRAGESVPLGLVLAAQVLQRLIHLSRRSELALIDRQCAQNDGVVIVLILVPQARSRDHGG